jgi:type IV pilus assembly protein PilB
MGTILFSAATGGAMKEPEKLRIGEILVQEGYITEAQLQEAIANQRRKTAYRPLGEVCVELRYLSKSDLQGILRKYQKRLYLGELLVNMGLIHPEDIEQALAIQKIEGKRLGSILIERGFLNEATLVNTLSTQLGIPKILPSPGIVDPTVLKGISKAFLLKNVCLPIQRDGDAITIIMSDPLSEDTVRNLAHVFKARVEPAIATADEIRKGIKLVFDDLKMVDVVVEKEKSPKNVYKNLIVGDTHALDTVEQNIAELLNFLLSNAVQDRATDIHIEPLENMLRVRYRVDGLLQHKTDLPFHLGATLVSRIKALCGLDIDDRRHHQDGRLGAQVLNKRYDLRISTYASINGEALAIRILPSQSNLMDLDMLGFSPANLSLLKQLLLIPSGILMVTGPSGAGKSTTLYGALRLLNSMDRKIVTVEDPVEFRMDGVIQGQISEKSNLLYSNFIKSMLRQDPDVLMVGEIRDRESALAVVETALTGHQVLTTFHTDDSVGALLRMFQIGVETFLITSSVMTVLAQRLVRLLCNSCKQPYRPTDEVLTAFPTIRPIDLDAHTFYVPTGCAECDNTGFRGRTGVHEILVLNNLIRDAILGKANSGQIRSIARESTRLVSLREDGFYKATRGLTSLEEVLRVTPFSESDVNLVRSSEEIVSLCEEGYFAE